ncbi:phosphoribosylanthranilate isomerase [Candidatus Woesearchaeota archaeon]|jgi:phosphoribosylanthranilate isomerase|nr:phosphoribosylanthranilate isomerase [Candidatus Woesearchaeota archaeon]MDP6647921.1 phosphoribosylanthranilate isomerase [Candidatus Woesearchaeota archaeon]|tara:strand:- start:11488 stop:12102 length:615 start_codon:yes stop_codon:yes gene_type:complete
MTKIKICGITNHKDAIDAVNLGADYLGFNFYKHSPRFVGKEKARNIIKKIQNDIMSVGVFVNMDMHEIKKIVKFCGIDIIQLSGDESPEFAEKLRKNLNKKVIKSIGVRNKKDVNTIKKFKTNYILLDTFKKGVYGGTGKSFDLQIAKYANAKKLFLSGGLNKSNVKKAVDYVNPYAVDVCSGIEKYYGKKDHKKMKEFIEVIK